MDGSTALWLAMTLAAPVTLVPKIALVRLVHSRRTAWQPLDVLIVTLLVAQLCSTILTLGFSAAALMHQAGLWPSIFEVGNHTPLCAVLICGWAAAHTLHAATLTSLAVDRAMTIRWPYKYRTSVRRTQLRYHVVVLTIFSILVGVAALFANSVQDLQTQTSLQHVLSYSSKQDPSGQSPLEDINQQLTADRNDSSGSGSGSSSSSSSDTPTNSSFLYSGEGYAIRDGCTFLPHLFDGRFSLFWLCLHAALFIATLAALVVIALTRIAICCGTDFGCCGGSSTRLGSGSDIRTLGNASEGSSATLPLPLGPPPPPPRYTPGPVATLASFGSIGHFSDAQSSSPLGQSHQNLFGSSDGKPYANLLHHDPKIARDFATPIPPQCKRQRHSTVTAVLIVAYLSYHLPLLVLTTLGTYFSSMLPDWPFSAMVLALGLAHSLFCMLLLAFVDPHIHAWMIDSLKPKSLRSRHPRMAIIPEPAALEHTLGPMKIDDETRYRMSQLYSHEPVEAKFPITNGSLFVHLMNAPCSEGSRGRDRRTSRMGISAYERHHRVSQAPSTPIYPEANPPMLTFMSRSQILAKTHVEPLYSDPIPGGVLVAAAAVASSSCSTSPLSPMRMHRNEPIYATLSETLTSSCNTFDSFNATFSHRVPQMLDLEADEGSATESAGDDFEFHNIRTSRQTLISHEDDARPTVDAVPFTAADLKPRSKVTRSATYRILCNGLDVKCANRDDHEAPKLTASSQSQHGLVTCVTFQDEDAVRNALKSRGKLSKSKLLTSLSMNDIDMVGDDSDENTIADEATETPIARTDSLFSLYKIQVPIVAAGTDPTVIAVSVPETTTRLQNQSHIRSSIELSRSHYNDGGRRKRLNRNPLPHQQDGHQQGMLHFRKKSFSRSRAAVLQRFEDRSAARVIDDAAQSAGVLNNLSIVSMDALKAALLQSPKSYINNGQDYPVVHQEKTVFVSEYI